MKPKTNFENLNSDSFSTMKINSILSQARAIRASYADVDLEIENDIREDELSRSSNPVCKLCHGHAHEVSAGDEGWTVCDDCGAVEQGYEYLTDAEFEAL